MASSQHEVAVPLRIQEHGAIRRVQRCFLAHTAPWSEAQQVGSHKASTDNADLLEDQEGHLRQGLPGEQQPR